MKKTNENYQKSCIFDEKTTKSNTKIMRNKPNSPIVQTDVTSFIKMIYTISASLTKVKNKPNQTQNKANYRKAKMSLKSLAGKSGHTRKNLDSGLSLIILLTIFIMPVKRQIFGFPQVGVPITQLWVLR